jgi:hypothetical protein
MNAQNKPIEFLENENENTGFKQEQQKKSPDS